MSILGALAPQLGPLLARPGQHGPCPICGGKDRARVFRDVAETGGFLCHNCGTYADGLATLQLMNGWTFRESLRAVAGHLGMVSDLDSPRSRAAAPVAVAKPHQDDEAERAKRQASIERVWSESVPASDPRAVPMLRYLASRGLGGIVVPAALRFHLALPYWVMDGDRPVKVGEFPAMLAAVVSEGGELVTVHRTYLTTDGRKLTERQGMQLEPRKKMPAAVPGSSRGAAVRLFPAAPCLGVAEGIETALSAHLLTGLPVWAALDRHGLEAIALPEEVGEVFIFADHDRSGDGQVSAVKLARRLKAAGLGYRFVIPSTPGTDWNDALLAGEVAHA